jgi:hypothetical protein
LLIEDCRFFKSKIRNLKSKIETASRVTGQSERKMKDEDKTKEQLINELLEFRQRITEMEAFTLQEANN